MTHEASQNSEKIENRSTLLDMNEDSLDAPPSVTSNTMYFLTPQGEHPQPDAWHERGQPGRSALGRLAGVLLLTRPQQEERQESFMQHWAQFITQWTWRWKFDIGDRRCALFVPLTPGLPYFLSV